MRRTGSSTTSCGSPDGSAQRLKVRSMVGLLPLCAVDGVRGQEHLDEPGHRQAAEAFHPRSPGLKAQIHDPTQVGHGGRRLAAILNEPRLRRVLAKMLDENEFLGPHGLRALSRVHADHPFVFHAGGQEYGVGYLPAESDSGMFGGNSNWRGPVWMPVNGLIVAGVTAVLRVLR